MFSATKHNNNNKHFLDVILIRKIIALVVCKFSYLYTVVMLTPNIVCQISWEKSVQCIG
jgi:hypothetical protein